MTNRLSWANSKSKPKNLIFFLQMAAGTRRNDSRCTTEWLWLFFLRSHQCDGHENENQGHVVENQHPVFAEERPDCLERVSTGSFGSTPGPLSVEVAQIHGVDVKDHVGSSKHDKAVHQPVTVYQKTLLFLLAIYPRLPWKAPVIYSEPLTYHSSHPCKTKQL